MFAPETLDGKSAAATFSWPCISRTTESLSLRKASAEGPATASMRLMPDAMPCSDLICHARKLFGVRKSTKRRKVLEYFRLI